MFSTLRTRFGIPGVISVIALVFAMFGGAYAASNSSGGGKATASAKAKKGPRGPKGATGPAGPAGPAGAKGDTGAAGSNGANGSSGAPGADGKSVEAETASGVKCPEGGTVFKIGGVEKGKACNGAPGADGATGPQGPKGDPWTAGGTLPVGATETGGWSFHGGTSDTNGILQAIGFTVPLATAPDASHVHWEDEANFADFDGGGAGTIGCKGSVSAPTAPSGNLCVYKTQVSAANFMAILTLGPALVPGGSTAGAILGFEPTADGAFGAGSWAVTG